MEPKNPLCRIAAAGGMIGHAECDLPWGHDGDVHSNGGDGFHSPQMLPFLHAEWRGQHATLHARRARVVSSESRDFAGRVSTTEPLVALAKLLAQGVAEGGQPSFVLVDACNFDSDHPDERYVALGIRSKEVAEIMAKALNDHPRYGGPGASRFVKVEEASYALKPGFTP
jgi:hypothetical protein